MSELDGRLAFLRSLDHAATVETHMSWVVLTRTRAYKVVDAVVDAAEAAGLARKVARLEPMIVVKG